MSWQIPLLKAASDFVLGTVPLRTDREMVMHACLAGLIAALLLMCAIPVEAQTYPTSVRSCFDTVEFDGPPTRPVVNDTNMVQTLIDMGLIDRFIGASGIGDVEQHLIAPPDVIDAIKHKESLRPIRRSKRCWA